MEDKKIASLLERAINIAVDGHRGQRDKAKRPYILHPLRVMSLVKTDIERIVAILHDVVEDCAGWTFERLELEGFPPEVIEPLRLVTKLSEDEDYDAFIARAATHPVSRAVKIADLTDNLDESRLGELTQKDRDRLAKYTRALAFLQA